MIAVIRFRKEPHYRSEAFVAGLKRAGYTLEEHLGHVRPRGREDLLVIWNRQPPHEEEADSWEARGGTVLVCENGYLGKDSQGRQLYAISAHGHNGSGWFPEGDEDRFSALGIPVAPWRPPGEYALVCGQRGIGTRQMRSPPNWEHRAAKNLSRMNVPYRVRLHPGKVAPKQTLLEELAHADQCVIWSSSAGVLALTLGIPVSYSAPHWICAAGAGQGFAACEKPVRDDEARTRALRHMAWGQWSIDEIESGEPFVMFRERLGEATWKR